MSSDGPEPPVATEAMRMQGGAGPAARLSRVPMPTLLLLPGMDGTGDLFDTFVAALPSTIDVVTVRYPPHEPLGYAELQALARAAMPEKGPFVILGESFSGPIAISLAASAPARLEGLILCCSFARNPRPRLSVLRPLINLLPIGWAPLRLLSHLCLGRFSTRSLRARLARTISQVSAAALRARLHATLSVDVTGLLGAVRVPVLELRASQDRLVPPQAAALLASQLPGAEIAELTGPHFLLQGAPQAAAEAVVRFMQRVVPSSPAEESGGAGETG